ncbi:MAG TPA: hypothetical protein VFQ00_12340 [Terriglobales bacterium]|nr:hypothetical protein [Terriglobales bacterium]
MGTGDNNNPNPNNDPSQPSGSGGDSSSGGDSNAYQPWQPPSPQATLGINSTIVYGEAIQAVTGSNSQFYLGSTNQITINPATLIGQGLKLPPALNAFASGGAGGNLTFTLGSTANVNIGPQFQINWGGIHTLNIGDQGDDPTEKWTTNTLIKVTNKAFCLVISGCLTAWFIAYGIMTDEDHRAQMVVTIQALVTLLAAAMLTADMSFESTHSFTTDSLKKAFVHAATPGGGASPFETSGLKKFGKGVLSLLPNVLSVLVAPAIVESTEEGHFLQDVWSETK